MTILELGVIKTYNNKNLKTFNLPENNILKI